MDYLSSVGQMGATGLQTLVAYVGKDTIMSIAGAAVASYSINAVVNSNAVTHIAHAAVPIVALVADRYFNTNLSGVIGAYYLASENKIRAMTERDSVCHLSWRCDYPLIHYSANCEPSPLCLNAITQCSVAEYMTSATVIAFTAITVYKGTKEALK